MYFQLIVFFYPRQQSWTISCFHFGSLSVGMLAISWQHDASQPYETLSIWHPTLELDSIEFWIVKVKDKGHEKLKVPIFSAPISKLAAYLQDF